MNTALLIEKFFGRSFKFHSNFFFKSSKTDVLFLDRKIGFVQTNPIFLSRNYIVLKKTSCYDDWNTFLYTVSISVVQYGYPGRQNLYSFFTVFQKILIMFHNFLISMASLKNGISLRGNTIYIRVLIFNGCN